jgi:hypothetical protein
MGVNVVSNGGCANANGFPGGVPSLNQYFLQTVSGSGADPAHGCGPLHVWSGLCLVGAGHGPNVRCGEGSRLYLVAGPRRNGRPGQLR